MKKAAFLLFAAAWLTGSVNASGRSSSCCAPSCDPCCDNRPGLLDRLRGLFHRNDCCDTCAPKCEVRCCQPACDNGCGRRGLFHRDNCCAPACPPACPAPACKPVCCPAPTCCDPCCDRPGLLDRLRARFHRNDCCCDPCAGGAVVTPKAGETITTPPKKLPGGGAGKTGSEGPTGEVRIITPPAAPVAPPAITIPAAPGLESRSPF